MKNLWIALSTFTLILVLVNFAYGEESETTDKQSFDYLGWILGIVGTPVGGLIGYLLKRYFVNRDFEFQKQIEHEKWLLQRFNNLADNYYVPLAKFSFDAKNSIDRAIVSKNELAIKIAYYHTSIFLSKYIEFKKNIGANFLLKPRTAENEAIVSVRAILSSLPFDDLDVNKIDEDIKKSDANFKEQYFRHKTFKQFKDWIESDYCHRSRQLILEKLNRLQIILDATSEQINHPEVVRKEIVKIEEKRSDEHPFFILFSNTKHIRKGESIVLFGGFDHIVTNYGFFIGTTQLIIETINKDNVRLKLPDEINSGVYDIFGTFSITDWSGTINDETIGIAINIE